MHKSAYSYLQLLLLLFYVCYSCLIVIDAEQSSEPDNFLNYKNAYQSKIFSAIMKIEPGNFNEPIKGIVNAENASTYLFIYDFRIGQHWAIYVCVRSEDATIHAPLLIVVKESLTVSSWEVPLKFSYNNFKHNEICHTLCPLTNYFDPDLEEGEQKVYVSFSTSSVTDVRFELTVSNFTDFVIETNEEVVFDITPSQSRVLEYHMPHSLNSVLVEAKSEEESCMILAIQGIQCPLYDSERTVEYKGFYQRMTLQSGITVTRKAFKEGKVYIVMILKPTDQECKSEYEQIENKQAVNKRKNVRVTVSPSITDHDFYAAIFGAFGFYLLLYLFSFIICCFLFVRHRRSTTTLDEVQDVTSNISSVQTYGSASTSSEESAVSANNVYVVPQRREMQRHPSSASIDETDIDTLPDIEHDKEVVRTKTVLYVVDLAKKKDKYLSQRTKVYSWNLITIAVFYGLPVVQLVYINQKIVNITGNQDLCYYNFLCSHKMWVFSDFNHVYSNIGYVMLGLLFLILVWRREVFDFMHKIDAAKSDQQNLIGIPHHFGLFYAMGWALVMEGILSASYHVCPNKANFQFDTAFMYVIATVCMLKLYQARHPDITAKSHSTWMLLSVVLLIGVAGVLQGGTLFWIAFVLAHITVTFLVSTTIYFMGRWKIDRWIFRRIFQYVKLDIAAGSFRPTYLGRFIILSIAVSLNIALDLFGLIKRPVNFAAFLLAVFIMNLLLYLIYYTIMKIRYKERIRWIPIMYIVLSFICWGAGLYYFQQKNTSWQMTPAVSRERNKHCVILNFYDDHDIWHFVSSCALFFSFMVLFTLDDDLEATPRSRIIVF